MSFRSTVPPRGRDPFLAPSCHDRSRWARCSRTRTDRHAIAKPAGRSSMPGSLRRTPPRSRRGVGPGGSTGPGVHPAGHADPDHTGLLERQAQRDVVALADRPVQALDADPWPVGVRSTGPVEGTTIRSTGAHRRGRRARPGSAAEVAADSRASPRPVLSAMRASTSAVLPGWYGCCCEGFAGVATRRSATSRPVVAVTFSPRLLVLPPRSCQDSSTRRGAARPPGGPRKGRRRRGAAASTAGPTLRTSSRPCPCSRRSFLDGAPGQWPGGGPGGGPEGGPEGGGRRGGPEGSPDSGPDSGGVSSAATPTGPAGHPCAQAPGHRRSPGRCRPRVRSDLPRPAPPSRGRARSGCPPRCGRWSRAP